MANTVLDANYPVKTWSRTTVADGDWLNINTIQPLIDRTNVIEADQANLLSMETELLDTIGEDMQLKAGNKIALIANDATKELSVSLIKSVAQISGNMAAEAIKFTDVSPDQNQAYFNLNANIEQENIKRLEGDKITVEGGEIYLNTGFYTVSCIIKITSASEFTPTEIYTFRLHGDAEDKQSANMSCLFNVNNEESDDTGWFNMTFPLEITTKTKLVLTLHNIKNLIDRNAIDEHILKSLTIIEE